MACGLRGGEALGHPRLMKRLPLAYGALLLFEAALLGWIYATDPPATSDPLSIWLGWAAIGSMVVMLIYSVARRSRRLRRVSRLSHWLHLHIFLGLQGVLFAAFHSFHLLGRIGNIVWTNPGVLAAVAVAIVFCSGLFGRYLYSWLPRAVGGEQLVLRELDGELAALEEPLPEAVVALWRDAPRPRGLLGVPRADLARRRALGQVRRLELAEPVRALALRRVDLERKKAMLGAAARTFRGWILLHRPLAAALYVLVIFHVLLAYMYSPALGR